MKRLSLPHTCRHAQRHQKCLGLKSLSVVLATLVRKGDLEIAQPDVHPERDGIFFSPNRGLEVRWRPLPADAA